jgi:glycosyltransferase involved in cell wall biosynthesis
MPGLIKRIFGLAGYELRRAPANNGNALPRAKLPASGKRRGSVLISYIPDDVAKSESDVSPDHTHFWECRQMAMTYAKAGFDVDVVRFDDAAVRPSKDYDLLVAARTDLERLSRLLPGHCLKIAHLDTAHFLTHNANALARLVGIRDRHGVALRSNRMVENNWAIEVADLGCVLGNRFTADSYAYAGKPIHRIPLSSVQQFDWDDDKDFESSRKTFLWFGSGGFAHKGLDVVIDAFTELPDHRLLICGPVDVEKRFVKAFHKQMYESTNIETIGWVDITSDRFRDITRRTIATIYPSCSEGGGGSVITCMHAGLIPIVTEEASVDIGDSGVVLEKASVYDVRQAVLEIDSADAGELERRARSAWNTARGRHTREHFAAEYAQFVEQTVLPELEKRKATKDKSSG